MSSDELVLYNADFCPFAQRAWIAVHELGIPFTMKYINYFDKGREDTKEFLAVSPSATVPAGVHKGNNVYDSLNMIQYLEEAFGKQGTLYPKDAYKAFQARALIEKHGKFVGAFYGFLMAQDSIEEKKEAYLGALKNLEADIVGPYFMGEDFTIVDVAFIPFYERAEILLSHYKKTETPKELTKVLAWAEKVKSRDGFKKTSLERTKESLEILPEDWADIKERKAFLIAVYEIYSKGGAAVSAFKKDYQKRMDDKRASKA